MSVGVPPILRLPQTGHAKPSRGRPNINWHDPITRGLTWCVPFFEGVNTSPALFRDLIGVVADLNNAVGAHVWTRGPPGLAVQPPATGNAMAMASSPTAGVPTIDKPFTLLLVMRMIGGLPRGSWFFLRSASTPPVRGLFVQYVASPDRMRVTLQQSGTTIDHDYDLVEDEDIILIAAKDPSPGSGTFSPRFTTWANGGIIRSLSTITANASPWRDCMLNGDFDGLDFSNFGNARWYLGAYWLRTLADAEAWRLTQDPFCFLRPEDDQPALPYYPIWRRMPCFDFESRRIMLKPIEQTAATAGVLLARKANRVDQERVEIRLETLDDEELAAVQAAWAKGDGLVVPFWMQLPGEQTWRRFVFADDRLAVEHLSSTARRVSVALIDVTRQG
jgi:hypothetical protein